MSSCTLCSPSSHTQVKERIGESEESIREATVAESLAGQLDPAPNEDRAKEEHKLVECTCRNRLELEAKDFAHDIVTEFVDKQLHDVNAIGDAVRLIERPQRAHANYWVAAAFSLHDAPYEQALQGYEDPTPSPPLRI